MRKFLVIFFLGHCFTLSAQSGGMYRLILTDKGNSPYSIERPEEFLSPKSIERRTKQGLSVNETDLPIDPAYFRVLTETGATIRASSKWVNTITIALSDDEVKNRVAALPFVKTMVPVWFGDFNAYVPADMDSLPDINSFELYEPDGDIRANEANYGDALTQISLNNALPLHEKGYQGAGITIAVIDAGFQNADCYPGILDTQKIRGVKNFTHQTGNPYRSPETHGTMVLSCMLANAPGKMIGTAPEANFYLFKTEVYGEEYPVEEDYWVVALEYADSLGVDIVSSSLGYTLFKDTTMNHHWDELDGFTIPASRAASMAASKGMVLFIAAGNEGSGLWQKATIPADAKNILTVGALKKDSIRASFSSWGILADGRIKPDVMALGQQTCVFNPAGHVATSRGTSFSTPVIAGMGACLWEALPSLSATQLMALIRESADRYTCPDEYYGYGIPNIAKAYVDGLSHAIATQQPR